MQLVEGAGAIFDDCRTGERLTIFLDVFCTLCKIKKVGISYHVPVKDLNFHVISSFYVIYGQANGETDLSGDTKRFLATVTILKKHSFGKCKCH